MSKGPNFANIKKSCGYTGSVARCSTCEHFREQCIRLGVNSETYRKNHHCGLGGFTVAPNATCNNWKKKP